MKLNQHAARLALCALLGAATELHAQDVSLSGGLLDVTGKHDDSFAAALSYRHPVNDNIALSLTYLNEGHPQDHHRDAVSAQAWLRSKESEQRLAFSAGAGVNYYFDTARNGTDYHNDHGWAPMLSVAASWHFPSRWFVQLQLDRVLKGSKDGTTSLLLGTGYRFDGVPGNKLHLNGPSSDDTLTVSRGQTIVNSFDSERSRATAIEYRRALSPYIDGTVTLLKEGETVRTRRSGVAAQLWLIRSLTTNTELGMGAGPYRAFDLHQVEAHQSRVAGLVSIAARYHFGKQWVGQLGWNRVVTDYHRDADVLLLGVGASY